MEKDLDYSRKNYYTAFKSNFLQFIIIFAIVLGIVFRLTNLEHKIVWHDEALTLSRVSGYYAGEINEEVFNAKIIRVKDFKKYQQRNLKSNDFLIIDVLATDNPQHPPVYYLLLRFWSKIFGQSIASFRGLSALFGILVLPLVYLLCRELWQSSSVGLIAMAIIAVSPVHLLYAQEAREYSLWTLSILISSVALLRAIKTKNILNWLFYAVSSLISFYIFPFSLLVSIGHGVYIAVTEKFRLTKISKSFLSAFSFALAGFSPWLLRIINEREESGSIWTEIPISYLSLLDKWGEHIYKALMLDTNQPSLGNIFQVFLLFLLIAIIVYSFYLLIKQTKRSTWLFLVILSSSLWLPLAGADLILGGQRSISTRYLLPSLIGFQISLAFGFVSCFKSNRMVKRKIAQILFGVIIFLGIVSCTVGLRERVTWSKGESYYLADAAQIINNTDNTLVIGNSLGLNFGNILALSHLLKDNISLLLVDGWNEPDYKNIPQIPKSFNNIFLISVSERFEDEIEQQYNADLESVRYNDQFNLKKLSLKK